MAPMPGAANVLQWQVQWVAKSRGGADPKKACPSPDWRLQFASMKLESLVIGDQHAPVNMFLSLVHTARQAMGAGSARSRDPNRQGR